MRRMKFWKRRDGSNESVAVANPEALFDEDEVQILRKRLMELTSANGPPSTFFSPDVRAMLCVDPEIVHDRATQLIAVSNLVAALILSGIAGQALAPIDVMELPEETRNVGSAVNILTAVLAAFSTCTTLFTAFLLSSLCSTSSSKEVYRFVLNSGNFIWHQLSTLLQAVLFLITMAMSHWIYSPRGVAIATIVLVALIFFSLYLMFMFQMRGGFPLQQAGWDKVTLCGLSWWLASTASREKLVGLASAKVEAATHLSPYTADMSESTTSNFGAFSANLGAAFSQVGDAFTATLGVGSPNGEIAGVALPDVQLGDDRQRGTSDRVSCSVWSQADASSPAEAMPLAKHRESNAGEAPLGKLLSSALPEMAIMEREAVIRAFLLEKLTVETLTRAWQTGGVSFVYELLSGTEAQLCKGERVLIAVSLAKPP